MIVQAEEIITILGERTLHIGSGNKVYLNVSLSELLLRCVMLITSNFFMLQQNLAFSCRYHFTIVLNINIVHFVVNFFL